MTNIIEALGGSGRAVVFAVYSGTNKYLRKYRLLDRMPENVELMEPVGYLDMPKPMSGAGKTLTDSGGVQKEAYVLGVFSIMLRGDTEWMGDTERGGGM